MSCLHFSLMLLAVTGAAAEDEPPASNVLTLHTRRRLAVEDEEQAEGRKFKVVEQTIEWDWRRTAVVVCDMWDAHWCRGAERRVAELAGPMNKMIRTARQHGALILHAPSTTVDFYEGTPQRKLAQTAPYAKPPIALATSMRWGTAWCWPDREREAELPIDDSDMGCDCAEKCEIAAPWTRQIATIEIGPDDAISDNGQEVYNLLTARGVDHILIMGVHLNMCVLGRPFAIRQLKHLGKDVVLVRDMTDTMYCSKMKPFVDHFSGTDLVIEHVEKYWCPTITSVDLMGGQPFRFAEDRR